MLAALTRPAALARRAVRLVADVRPQETGTALLMALNGFVLMMAYACIKPVREALILAHVGGAEYRAYAAGATALLLLLAVPLYSRIGARLPRNRLVVGTTLFFASHLLLFAGLGVALGSSLWFAVGFYVWIAIFNMMIVAQFWAFANDLYAEEPGRRVFPLLGFGVSLGAVAGAATAEALIARLGVMPMMVVATAMLSLSATLSHWIHSRETAAAESADARAAATAVIGGSAGEAFRAILQDRYLLYIAGFSLVFTLVKTNGDYVLARAVEEAANQAVRAGTLAPGHVQSYIGETFASITFWVDAISLLLQGLVVSRVVKYFGFGAAFYALPFLALGDAVLMTMWPVLAAVRIGKTVESATDYSLNNTVRNMLWLPTSRRVKYMAKQATDTFCVRAGDISSAALIFMAVRLGLPGWAIPLSNVALVVAWLLLARGILRERGSLLLNRGGGRDAEQADPRERGRVRGSGVGRLGMGESRLAGEL
jgi:ATP:ADP antiporter, AAA family